MDYDALLDWLYSTQMFGFKLGLDNPKRLLRQFKANPALGVKVVHVAGTNGKGSTCAMAESIARAAGYRTGLFTSPHLMDFRERIRVNGEMIPQDALAELLTNIKEIAASWAHHPTFFELALALALKHFKNSQVEIIFLETGMGGRLDATNAVAKDIAVLTPIGMDHAQWLGETLTKIAEEKADIIAEGKPVITSLQAPEVMEIIEQVADERRSPLTLVSEALKGYGIALEGAHQEENAALATTALHALGLDLRTDIVAQGLRDVRWPGRFESVGKDFILDGAHNTHAIPALINAWKNKFGDRRTSVVFSAVADKDIRPVLDALCPLADSLHFAPIDSPRALPVEEFPEMLPASYTGGIHVHTSLDQALTAAKLEAREKNLPALVCGSLYLIGEVKGIFEKKQTRRTAQ